jgi:hypothetical protein
MKINYNKAKRYTTKCGKSIDIVHDAFVAWWDKKGTNLFLENEGTVLRVIKNIIYKEYGRSTFMVRGVKYPKVTYSYDDSVWDSDVPSIRRDVARMMTNNHSQEELEIKEYYNSVTEKATKLTGTYRMMYTYLSQGFTPTDIEEIEGISSELVHYYRRQLKLRLN